VQANVGYAATQEYGGVLMGSSYLLVYVSPGLLMGFGVLFSKLMSNVSANINFININIYENIFSVKKFKK
jgi:hypothetical protein